MSEPEPLKGLLPNVIRCPRCNAIVLIDLLSQGFTPEEIAAKQATHERNTDCG